MTTVSTPQSVKCRRLGVMACVLLELLLVLLPWPFWREAVSGRFHYVTPLGISGYALSAMCVGAVLHGLLSSRHRSTAPAWTLLPAIALVAVPLLNR